jgi:hypothetical protein
VAGYYLGQRTGDDKPRFNGTCSQDYLSVALIDGGGVGSVHLVSAQGVLFFPHLSLRLDRQRFIDCPVCDTGWPGVLGLFTLAGWIGYTHIAFCIRMFCLQAQSPHYMENQKNNKNNAIQ